MSKRKIGFSIVVTMVLACVPTSASDSPSDLLEKGIYAEETVGDLDEAIRIYEEIITQAEANRGFVAQAQLRLGQCLLKQGKRKEAEEAFGELVERFKASPDQKELVAKARELLPDDRVNLELEPVPWVDGEHLELRIKLGSGLEIGDFILSARSGTVDGREVWHLGINRNIMMNAPNLGLSSVVVDRHTFQPTTSLFDHPLLGKVSADYEPNQVTIRTQGNDGNESVRKMDLDGVYYDNEQAWQLFRRLPLADDYRGTIPIFTTMGSGPVTLDLEVTGTETVEAPAGTFECYKVFVKPVQQTFWISKDVHHYAVKFEAGGVSGILQSIRQVTPGSTVEYSDTDLGFSVSAPADWYFIPDKISKTNASKRVVLVDPGAVGFNTLLVEPLEELDPEHSASIRAWADEKIANSKRKSKNFQVLADSWQERTVAGYPALSFVATLDHGESKVEKYYVLVLGESTASHFVAHTAAGRMDDFRKEFDKVIDSYKVK